MSLARRHRPETPPGPGRAGTLAAEGRRLSPGVGSQASPGLHVMRSRASSYPRRGRWGAGGTGRGLGRGTTHWLRGPDEEQTGQSLSGKDRNYLVAGRVLDQA